MSTGADILRHRTGYVEWAKGMPRTFTIGATNTQMDVLIA